MRLPEIGEAGQARLAASRVVVVGCGATGCAAADTLTRAGVGALVLVDRDYVEWGNLHRQRLYVERDAVERRPKAIAARDRLMEIDRTCEVVARAVDFGAENALALLAGADLAIDGTDNFESRYVLNDACRERAIPWIHVAVVGAVGQALVLRPDGPCFACYLESAPVPGTYETCDTAGVLGATVDLVAAVAASLALGVLVGRTDLPSGVVAIDALAPSIGILPVARRADCPTCRGERPYLAPGRAPAARLCGRDAVLVSAPRSAGPLDLPRLADALAPLGTVRHSEEILRFVAPDGELLVFAAGHVIVRGTESVERARGLVARYIGR